MIGWRAWTPVAALALVIGLTTPEAWAEPPPNRLPFFDVYQALGDPLHGRVLVTGGPDETGLAVVGSDGMVQQVLDGFRGASGMVIAGDSLFVAKYPSAIVRVDLDTLEVVHEYPMQTDECPKDLGYAGGRIWFGGRCPSWHNTLDSLDPATGVTHDTISTYLQGPPMPSSPIFATANNGLDTLVLNDGGWLDEFDISSGTPVPVLSAHVFALGRPVIDPDHQHVIARADNGLGGVVSFRLSDLSRDGAYSMALQGASPRGNWLLDSTGDMHHLSVSVFETGRLDPVSGGEISTEFPGGQVADVAFTSEPGAVVVFERGVWRDRFVVDAHPLSMRPTDPPPMIPPTQPAHAVMDSAHGHLFVTSGPGGHSVTVLDGAGRVVDRIEDLPGADAMSIAGGRLWISLSQADSFATVDLDTLQVDARFRLGSDGDCPEDFAVAGGLVWYDPECSWSDTYHAVRWFDPATGAGGRTDLIWSFTCCLLSSPAFPDDLFLGRLTESGRRVIEHYRVTGYDLSLEDQVTSPMGSWTLSPDGSLVAGVRDRYVDVRRLPDLSLVATVADRAYPTAVAVSEDDQRVAVAFNGNWRPEVEVYPMTGGDPERSYRVSPSCAHGLDMDQGKVAFVPGTHDVLALPQSSELDPASAATILHHDLATSGVEISASPDVIAPGDTTWMHVRVEPGVPCEYVTVWPDEGHWTYDYGDAVFTDADGTASVPVTLTDNATMHAEFESDGHFTGGESAPVLVRVVASTDTWLSRAATSGGSQTSSGDGPLVHAVAYPLQPGWRVVVVLQRKAGSVWQSAGRVARALNDRGHLTVDVTRAFTIHRGVTYRVAVRFPGLGRAPAWHRFVGG